MKQAEEIRRWMPWTLSTGPQTAEGKAKSSRNAWKGPMRASFDGLKAMLRVMAQTTKTATARLKVNSSFVKKRKKPIARRKLAIKGPEGSSFAGLEKMLDRLSRTFADWGPDFEAELGGYA